MVVVFHPNSPVFHHHAHPAAQVISHILGRRHMIPAFVRHFIAVIARRIQAVIPVRLPGINAVAALSGRHFEAGTVEKIEFEFRSDHHSVRNSAFLHIFNSTQTDIFRILVKRPVLPFSDSTYVTAHSQSRHLCKRVHIGGIRVWQKYHITLLNGCIAIIGTVKTDTIGKSIHAKPFHRNRDVSPASVDIRHLEVYHTDLLLLA